MSFSDWIINSDTGGLGGATKLQNQETWGYTVSTGGIRVGISSLYNTTSVSFTDSTLHTMFRHNNPSYLNLTHDNQVDIQASMYVNNVAGPTNAGNYGVVIGTYIGCWADRGASQAWPKGFFACYERRSPLGGNTMEDYIVIRGWKTYIQPYAQGAKDRVLATTTPLGVLGITLSPEQGGGIKVLRLVATPISLTQKLLQVYYGSSTTPLLSYVVNATEDQWSETGYISFGSYFRGYFNQSGTNSSTGNWYTGAFNDFLDEENRYPRLGFDDVSFNVKKYLST